MKNKYCPILTDVEEQLLEDQDLFDDNDDEEFSDDKQSFDVD